MGLLTNPNTDDSNKISLLLHKYAGRIGIVSYIGGIVWFVFLANSQYNLGTYFSENALLPGLVVENFYDGHKAENYFQVLNGKEESNGRLNPGDFVEAFQNIGLHDIEEQNFTVYDPITKVPTHGTNVFGILRAKRSSGTESVIFNVPYFPGNSKYRKNTPAVALMLALAEYFSSQVYWAKDIVFLIAESHMGSLAWVKGHQEIRDSNKYLEFERVRNKAGNIQAAVNFVLESNKVCSLSTKFHGINGQLPNLDVVNLINKFVVTEYEKRANWEADFWKLVNYMKTQATGTTSGSHGYFLKFGIESVTLYGARGGKSCRNVYSFGDMGRYIEATYRSLNNLLERLHQSFFFYLKTTPNRFISIGLYFPPLALIVFPILLKAASIWLTQNNLEITKALFIMITVHTLAIGSRWALSNLDLFIQNTADMKNETLKQIVLVLEALQFIITVLLIRRSSPSLISCVYCFMVLQVSAALYCFALFNPSLIVLAGVVCTPLFTLLFFFDPAQRKVLFYFSLSVIIGLISYFYNFLGPIIAKYFVESESYGNLGFDLVTLSLLPAAFTLLAIM